MDMEQMNLNTMLMALQASSSGIQEIPQSLPQETPATVNPLGFPINPAILNQIQAQLQLQLNMQLVQNFLQQQQQQLATAAALAQIQRTSPEVKEEETMDVEESQSSFDNQGDIIVPSNDKEGWCRNKKYIERVNGGFQCTVCKKIYGRYNSVSYHVTIYHRNPPIRCDIPGCQFSTREARYIHFHKYYRHGIALPTSIDQGSRRCQYCRHVSKSPAMLEKHMKRHQGLESRMASPMPIKEESPKIKCDILNCGFECDDVATLTEHAEACHFAGRNRGLSFTVNHEGEVEETKPRSTTLC